MYGHLSLSHVPGDENDADIFKKNATSAIYERHIPKFVGTDEYIGDREVSR